MHPDQDGLRLARVLSVVAATWVAFSCGTNYAYSAWGPQYAERLHLTATQSNIIGNAANVGMYASGIPIGLVIDKYSPRWGTLIGAACLACGYFPLWAAYDKGPDGSSIVLLCIASLLTGIGSCAAFAAAIKVSASNWPQHRGTATALPLSGFGLSAFLYTGLSKLLTDNDAEDLLLLLAIGTFSTVSTGMIFLRMIPPSFGYSTIIDQDQRLDRTSNHRESYLSSGTNTYAAASGAPGDRSDIQTSPLLSESRSSSSEDLKPWSSSEPGSHPIEITGRALLINKAFWKLFVLLGILCGVGLMTINNIGNDAKTLWHQFDPTASRNYIQSRQSMHVGILSVCSFVGRLMSGIGSDVMVKYYHSSRYWSLVASAVIFATAQALALLIMNPNLLFLVSGATGLGYGALFGVYPAIVADNFGAKGMGINWGAMTMAPVLSGNIFNLIYGAVLDSNSDHPEGEERVCLDGKACYSSAYVFTLVASVLAIGWSLWCVHLDNQERRRRKSQDLHEP